VRKLADEGAVLAPGVIAEEDVGGIVEMVDLNSLEIDAEVSEDQLPRVELGQPVLIFIDAYPDRVYQGRAETVRPAIERARATAIVKVSFQDQPDGVLPDMAAQVSFLEEALSGERLEQEARLRVPASAVVERERGPVVLVVKDGRLVEVPVQVAQEVGDEAVLKTGPDPGTQVVAAPTDTLREGRRVRVRAEGS